MTAVRAVRILLLGVLLLGLLPAAAAFAEGPPAFKGKVVDSATGDPLAYATVRLFEGETFMGETTTDQWGSYEFPMYFTDYRTYWIELWNKTCFARISRTGWTSMTTSKMTFAMDTSYEPADFGTAALSRAPGITPQAPIYGENRYGTALRISQAAYPFGLDGSPAHVTTGTVVIAAGDSWADALLAASVAGVENAPVILAGAYYTYWGYPYPFDSYWNDFGYDPMAEIRRLDPERAIIVGGEEVVPVEAELNLKIWLGADDVVRLWGDDRYGTAREASAYVMDNVSQPATMALVATGDTYADVLAASAVIWRRGLPLYLSSVEGLDQASVDEMVSGGITDVMIVGGEAAVAPGVEADLQAQFGDAHVNRIGGVDRYETSALVADWAVSEFGMGWSNVALASGQRYADALTGGPLQGRSGSVLLLTRHAGLPPVIFDAIDANASEIEEVRFLGGPAAVSKDVWKQVGAIVD